MSDYDSDSTGTNFNNWTPPSYDLGGKDTSPGIKVDTSGNYQLGTGLGTSDTPQGPTFGGSHYTPEQQEQLLNNMYKNPDFSLNQMYGTINSPLLGENEKVNWQNLSEVQKDLGGIPKLPITPMETSSSVKDANDGAVNWFKPGGLAYRLGLRNPGSEAAKDFFKHETISERNDRMGLVGNAIGNVAQGITRMVMPAPVSMALTGVQAYNNYQKTGDWKQALAQAMGGAGGYTGAVGQALQGNYGSALTGALSKGGANPLVSMTTGTALDAATGKNVNQNLGQIAGYALGRQQGGAPGAVLGAFAGRSLANIFGKNK